VNDDVGDNGDVIAEENNLWDVLYLTLTSFYQKSNEGVHIPYIFMFSFTVFGAVTPWNNVTSFLRS